MKAPLKTGYYIAVVICIFQSVFWLLGPFAGLRLILDRIKQGLYKQSLMECMINHTIHSILHVLNMSIAMIYFASLFFCIITLFFAKSRERLKYYGGIYAGSATVLILILGIILRKYGCGID